MLVPATLLIGIGFVINVADTVPRYDVKPTCQAAINLAAGLGRTPQYRAAAALTTSGPVRIPMFQVVLIL